LTRVHGHMSAFTSHSFNRYALYLVVGISNIIYELDWYIINDPVQRKLTYHFVDILFIPPTL